MQRRLLPQAVEAKYGKGAGIVYAAQHASLRSRRAFVLQAKIHDIRDAAEPRCIQKDARGSLSTKSFSPGTWFEQGRGFWKHRRRS